MCEAADALRRATVGDVVTFVGKPQHHYTNVCTYRSGSAALQWAAVAQPAGQAIPLTLEDIVERVVEAARPRGATEVCLQGASPRIRRRVLPPPGASGEGRAPTMHVHGFTLSRSSKAPAAWVSPSSRISGGSTRRSRQTAGHLRPRSRRRDRAVICPTDHHRRMAGGCTAPPPGRAALQHHDHVRHGRAAPALGQHTAADAGPSGRDRRVHRIVPLPFVHMAATHLP